MKAKIILLSGLIFLALNSCLIKSLHPFYKEKDVVFSIRLLGQWMDQDSGQWMISQYMYSKGFLSGDTMDNSYEIVLKENETTLTRFNAHLFKVGGNHFLDFYPIGEERTDMYEVHSISAHTLAKVEIGEKLKISWFNEDWLKHLFEENRIKISHEKLKVADSGEDMYVLTASTEELQKFLLKYGDDERAFKNNWGASEEDKEKEAFSFTLTRQ